MFDLKKTHSFNEFRQTWRTYPYYYTTSSPTIRHGRVVASWIRLDKTLLSLKPCNTWCTNKLKIYIKKHRETNDGHTVTMNFKNHKPNLHNFSLSKKIYTNSFCFQNNLFQYLLSNDYIITACFHTVAWNMSGTFLIRKDV